MTIEMPRAQSSERAARGLSGRPIVLAVIAAALVSIWMIRTGSHALVLSAVVLIVLVLVGDRAAHPVVNIGSLYR